MLQTENIMSVVYDIPLLRNVLRNMNNAYRHRDECKMFSVTRNAFFLHFTVRVQNETDYEDYIKVHISSFKNGYNYLIDYNGLEF